MFRFLIFLVVLGLVAWLITLLPLPAPFPTIIWAVLVLMLIWEILALAGYTKSYLNRNPPS